MLPARWHHKVIYSDSITFCAYYREATNTLSPIVARLPLYQFELAALVLICRSRRRPDQRTLSRKLPHRITRLVVRIRV